MGKHEWVRGCWGGCMASCLPSLYSGSSSPTRTASAADNVDEEVPDSKKDLCLMRERERSNG